MLKKKILFAAYSVLLCLTVSFAWILNPERNVSDSFFIEYGGDSTNSLVVSPKDIEMLVYAQKLEQWKLVGSSTDKKDGEELFKVDAQKVIPNSSVPFRIRLKNKSEKTVKVRITLTGIVCDQTLVDQEIIYTSALGSMEYSKYDVTVPENVYLCLNTNGELVSTDDEKNTAMYNLVLYEEVEIPVTENNDYVELDCYFYFDKDRMTNVCQNKTFYVSSFRAEQQ